MRPLSTWNPAWLLALGLMLTPLAAGPQASQGPAWITTASGLKFEDLREGDGALPMRGQRIVVHYTGWLAKDGRRGRKFDSSRDRRKPLEIPVGVGKLIQGWDEGLLSMRVGGKRLLLVPSELGYGAKGSGKDIPPDADLLFEVELLGVK